MALHTWNPLGAKTKATLKKFYDSLVAKTNKIRAMHKDLEQNYDQSEAKK